MSSELHTRNLVQASDLASEQVLAGFLANTTYPWEALGEALSTFLRAFLESLPPAPPRTFPGAVVTGPVWIHPEAVVEPGACVQGPAYVGPKATIGHCAYVRGPVYVAAQSVIGHCTEIKGSIVLPGAKAAHFAYIGDSFLGAGANLGAGTRLANLRFDHGLISVASSPALPTQLKKLGAILGTGAQTGCNAVTNPGTVLLPGAWVRPNQTATGIVAPLRSRRP